MNRASDVARSTLAAGYRFMTPISISPWILLALCVPVLMLGELLVRRVKPIARFDLPAAIVGGLVIALTVLVFNIAASKAPSVVPTMLPNSGTQPVATLPTTTSKTTAKVPKPALTWRTAASEPWWTWLVMAEPEWHARDADGNRPSVDVYVPFSTLFFTSIGLCASWRVVRQGSWQLLLFLAIAGLFAIAQNALGVALARAMGQHAVLGLLCGGVTLSGGLNTAIANEPLFREAGFAQSRAVGAAAVMFGVITASLLAGAVGGMLIRHRHLGDFSAHAAGEQPLLSASARPRRGFFDHLFALGRGPGVALLHLLLIVVCVKIGAWLGMWIRGTSFIAYAKLKFPIYIPALLLAIAVRNVLDLINPRLVRTEVVERIGGVALGIFLVAAISSLDLLSLKGLAGPMLVILIVQVAVMICFALLLTFWLMGHDYDAAVMSTGHIGFGLGMTTNAVATMDVLVARFGPAPRAFLVVTIVGGFLIDIVNSFVIVGAMNLLQRMGLTGT